MQTCNHKFCKHINPHFAKNKPELCHFSITFSYWLAAQYRFAGVFHVAFQTGMHICDPCLGRNRSERRPMDSVGTIFDGSKVAAAADLPKAISVSTIWSRLSCRAKPSSTKPRGRRKHLKLAQKFPK